MSPCGSAAVQARMALRRPLVNGWSKLRLDSSDGYGAPPPQSAGQNNEAFLRPLHVLCAGWPCRGPQMG